MIHSTFLVLFLCYPSWWWQMGWRRGFNAPLYVWQETVYPLQPIPRVLSSLQFCWHHWHIKRPRLLGPAFLCRVEKMTKDKGNFFPLSHMLASSSSPPALSCCTASLPEVRPKRVVVAKLSCSESVALWWCCAPASPATHNLCPRAESFSLHETVQLEL